MIIRQATIEDIPQMHVVRLAVRENALSNPMLVQEGDYIPFLTEYGRGWVALIKKEVVGFAIVDMQAKNVWALFVAPSHERKGIGRILHDTMLDWYFAQTSDTLWLGTAPGTRAETFYRKAGWQAAGNNGPQEIRFEMRFDEWNCESCN